jgi:hypothetical protein
MKLTERPVRRTRLLLSLLLINAVLLGGINRLAAQDTLGRCGCCILMGGSGGLTRHCCIAETCGFGQTCCTQNSDCSSTNCNEV